MVEPAAIPGKQYQDFEIIIERSGDTVYPVRCRAPNGATGHSAFDFPYNSIDLERRLNLIERSLLLSLRKVRRAPEEEQPVQDFGRDLFNALFTGEVRELYSACLASLDETDGLRVRLSIEEPQLAALPWEFLYDPRQRAYLCLSARTPLVRHIEIARPTSSLAVKFPLRVLGMVANPANLEALDVEAEKEHIRQALAGAAAAGQVQLEWLEGSTWRDLQQAMQPRRGPWHVFHFIGHGGFDAKREEGYISLANADGRSFDLYASDLAMLLGDHPALRLVVLNACQGGRSASGMTNDQFTSTAATLLNTGIPAVLAMQYAISDTAAIELARSFYSALVDEAPLEMALTEARKAIRLSNQSLEWAVPVLYSHTSDGVLYRREQEETQVRGAAEKRLATPPPGKPKTQPPRRFYPGLRFDPQTRQITFDLNNDITLEMIYIPEGPFQMGTNKPSNQLLNGNERPEHKVAMYPYWISRYPVTREQMAAVKALRDRAAVPPQGADGPFPVVMLPHSIMKAFCAYLKYIFLVEQPIPFQFNLPTEAEWEKAARGTDGSFFPYGNSSRPGFVNSAELKIKRATAVRQFSPQSDSPYGCADMAGNVWEMTRTLYAHNYLRNLVSMKWVYPFQHEDGRNVNRDPQAPYIIRGGSFKEPLERCNALIRDWEYGDRPRDDLGFRVALTPLDAMGHLPETLSMQPVFAALTEVSHPRD